MKISAVLHNAADKFLAHDTRWISDDYYGGFTETYPADTIEYSCDTLFESIHNLYPDSHIEDRSQLRKRIITGLRELGLDTNSVSSFNMFDFGKERQGARYSWLKFCALLAEEQGE